MSIEQLIDKQVSWAQDIPAGFPCGILEAGQLAYRRDLNGMLSWRHVIRLSARGLAACERRG